MEEKKCKSCPSRLSLQDIGGIGKMVHHTNFGSGEKYPSAGVTEIHLYQCPACKTVILLSV